MEYSTTKKILVWDNRNIFFFFLLTYHCNNLSFDHWAKDICYMNQNLKISYQYIKYSTTRFDLLWDIWKPVLLADLLLTTCAALHF